MQYAPIHGAMLKVHNAANHFNSLAKLLETLTKDEYFYVALEDDPENEGKQILQIRQKGIFPANFALTLGDAIHNLRSSLDILACDLVRLNGKSPKDVYFPIAKSADEFPGLLKKKHFNRTSDEAQKLIASIMPFTGGNDLLRVLHDLDITDKHQLIIPIAAAMHFESLNIEDAQGGMNVNIHCTYGAGYGWRCSKGSKIEQRGGVPSLFFPFDLPAGIGGKGIFELLEKLIHLVEGIIQSFAALYPSINMGIEVTQSKL